MKKFILLIFVSGLLKPAAGQQNYWQQQVNYVIDVSLNDTAHTLNGFEKIDYTNNSPDTLHFIWFHIWPNAYKNDKTALSEQLLKNGKTDFYFSSKENKGYINRLDFKVNNVTAQTEDHPEHIDIIKVILPSPLLPKQKATISTPFHVKLPYNFSRSGHDGQTYQVTQWYPKPAVYDKNGWNEMPYLETGEFYSEFGNYTVNISVPKNYVVAATGELQNADEKEWLKNRSDFFWEPQTQKEKTAYGQTKKIKVLYPESSNEIKKITFIQNNVHDFAWFADKRFIVKKDTLQLASGRTIDVFAFFTKKESPAWQNAIKASKEATAHYSTFVGEYPYNTVSVVEGPKSFGGGMEYPTITVIAPIEDIKLLDNVIAHEIGHNWFYGILGNNERRYAWMDEGMNKFYDSKYDSLKHGKPSSIELLLAETAAALKLDQPISTASEKFSESNYFLSVYYKASAWMQLLEEHLGKELFNKVISEYFNRWKFKHPQPEDFKTVAEQVSGRNLDTVFSYLGKTGLMPNQKRTGSKLVTLLTPQKLREYFKTPSKHLFSIGFVPGINSYDKIMAGLTFSNFKIPPSKFQFFIAPLYATGSKKLNGTGSINLSLFPGNFIRKADINISASRFSSSSFNDDFGKEHITSYRKISPGLKLIFKEKSHTNNLTKYIQYKSYFFQEDNFDFYNDTLVSDTDTLTGIRAGVITENRTLQQLRFVIENYRALYPYRGELKLEMGKDFARAAITGNYFFNYAKGGGLKVRLFAGKFFYTTSKTSSKQFSTDRFHLNMTGANGYEDYTYSDYFIGRNKFEGLASQQIMERDGAFKIRTDLLANKIGRTDNWLIAANFSTSIPSKINPLNVLPFQIPLRLFVDIGTYSDAWEKNAETDRFIFDAGLHLPLLKETINIYLPLFYSSVYKDYIQSTIPKKGRLWKTISFSIDISNFSLKKFIPNIPY